MKLEKNMRAKFSIDAVNLDGINDKQMELIKKLNTSLCMNNRNPRESIMHYEQFCCCDDGFLCEHRLQVIVDWLKK